MLELSEASSQTVIELTDETTPGTIALQAVEQSGVSTMSGKIRFEMECHDEVKDIAVRTNLRYAARALTLLLDNAKKFTKEGSIRLIVSQEPAAIVFSVEDSGIGIPPQEAEHIFEEFVQLDEYYDGTGIGLPVARSIVRRMHGDIRLDTDYRPGARFIMTLPKE